MDIQKLKQFAALVEKDQIDYLHKVKLACESNVKNARTSIKEGVKYTKVDVGNSGKFMVVNATGDIYGIKAYGVIHKGHRYGTLDTTYDYYWGCHDPVMLSERRW